MSVVFSNKIDYDTLLVVSFSFQSALCHIYLFVTEIFRQAIYHYDGNEVNHIFNIISYSFVRVLVCVCVCAFGCVVYRYHELTNCPPIPSCLQVICLERLPGTPWLQFGLVLVYPCGALLEVSLATL